MESRANRSTATSDRPSTGTPDHAAAGRSNGTARATVDPETARFGHPAGRGSVKALDGM
jgi:hypothetical protein